MRSVKARAEVVLLMTSEAGSVTDGGGDGGGVGMERGSRGVGAVGDGMSGWEGKYVGTAVVVVRRA